MLVFWFDPISLRSSCSRFVSIRVVISDASFLPRKGPFTLGSGVMEATQFTSLLSEIDRKRQESRPFCCKYKRSFTFSHVLRIGSSCDSACASIASGVMEATQFLRRFIRPAIAFVV